MTLAPRSTAPAAVYLLADNLDAALAAGEDLLTARLDVSLPTNVGGSRLAEAIADRHRFIDKMKSLELTLIQRALRAREHATEVALTDSRFKSIASLLAGGTTPLLDAVEELGGAAQLDHPLRQDAVAYLRSRGVIGAEAAGFEGLTQIAATETFLVAQRIELGPLLDMFAAFLDSLEVHFELFVEADGPEPPRPTLDDIIAQLS